MKEHPECAFVSGHYREIAVDGSLLSTPEQPCIEREHYMEILRANYIINPAVVMYRRSALESVGDFNTSSKIRGSEDRELCLRIARKFPVYCHGKTVAEYRIHGSSTSHNYAQMLRASTTVRRSQWKYVQGNERYEKALAEGVRACQEYYGTPLAYAMLAHVQKREWKQALLDALVLLRYYPRLSFRPFRKLRRCVRFRLQSLLARK